MSAYITAIGTANPKYKISQKEVLSFMQRAHGLNHEEAKQLEVLYRATGIVSRYSVIEDYKKNKGFTFYPNNASLSPFPSTKIRGDVYKKEVVQLSKNAITNAMGKAYDYTQISHLITVTCTGMYAPGLDIELVRELGLKHTIERTAINFMGCYAAFNAIKAARNICGANPQAQVLIVCTELCSIHFQKEKTDDNLLANALFGDGSAAVVVSNEPTHGINLSLDHFLCDLLPNGSEEMAWEVGDLGFEMKLSSYVPDVIHEGVGKLINSIKELLGDTAPKHYAIHPGGKKILNVLENALAIDKTENAAAHEVLKRFGNMSSPTILFVLKHILTSLNATNAGDKILSFAFGPGLTLESMVLTVKHVE